jgi:hypothetical protein
MEASLPHKVKADGLNLPHKVKAVGSKTLPHKVRALIIKDLTTTEPGKK